MTLLAQTFFTPLGDMLALCSAQGVHLLDYADRAEARGFRLAREAVRAHHGMEQPAAAAGEEFEVREARAHLQALVAQLTAYFDGTRREFDLALVPYGTPFQLAVWQVLRAVPYGHTRSYADEAHALGQPGAVRAVAMANGRNPLAIVVPCHRIIASDGRLAGYTGGVERKRALLALEAGQTSCWSVQEMDDFMNGGA